MIVDTVSPTPFALLRRANHFQYRDDDRALKEWSEYEDPIQALTEECRRVLRAISAANQSQAVSSSKHSTGLRDASWSRFEDIGFASALEEDDVDDETAIATRRRQQGLRNTPASGNGDLGRPTTPSWADFLSSGFVDERGTSNMLLPPDKVLPPIDTGVRQRSSQSHRPRLETDHQLEPGELASIVRFDLDDAFWWVWMSSLAPEETPERKAAFGRCAVIETIIRTGRWLVMEEIVKGAAPDPEEGAYIAEKKGFFSWTRRGKGVNRRKSTAGKHALDRGDGMKSSATMGFSKTSIGPDQQAKIQAAALQLQRQEQQKTQQQAQERRGRKDTDYLNEKTNSVLTLQPSILNEASSAVKWASKYDKEAIREAYLADANAGRGLAGTPALTNGHAAPAAGDQEARPELPPKVPSSSSRPAPVAVASSSSVPRRNETPTPQTPTREEKETELPKATHPAERVSSPVPPPKEPESMELAREHMVSPEPDMSPERQKQKKLHKEIPKASGGNGLMKLFSRNKNRSSKLPENAAEQLKSFTAVEQHAPAPAAPAASVAPAAPAAPAVSAAPAAPTAPAAPVAPVAPVAPAPSAASAPPAVPQKAEARRSVPNDDGAVSRKPVGVPSRVPVPAASPVSPPPVRAPVPAPQAVPEPVPAPASPVPQEVSPVSTRDDVVAREEFSRFNQGPLLDQPAFVPEDDADDADEAVPPPIARHSPRIPSPEQQQPERKAAAPPPAPVARTNEAQDRWAQIRKNAAERAAQRQAVSARVGSMPADDDSSEESKHPPPALPSYPGLN